MEPELDLSPYLKADDEALARRWEALQRWVEARFEREPTLEAILFLIGIQSRGHGYAPDLDRDVKQQLIMEGTYCVFARLGLYEQVGMEEDGSWIWARTATLPTLSVEQQEKLLQMAVLTYFEEINAFPSP